jgi:hypothetical protein
LDYIIRNKYSAVLKLEENYVYAQDDVQEYLQKKKDSLGPSSHSMDRATISMTININNVDQELCGHFLWDLADKAIRDNFKFRFDGDASNALHSSSQEAIAVDEFEAHHTIVTWAFKYLSREPRDETKEIGQYLVYWLPYHLSCLRQLEDEDKGALVSHELFEMGQNLYKLFKDDVVFRRHKAAFEKSYWTAVEMEDVQKWMMDSAIVRRLDKTWRGEVQRAANPTRGYLREFVRVVLGGFLEDRSWDVHSAYDWIENFMVAVSDP